MNQLSIERSTDVIAAEINAIKYQTQTVMLQASAEIGKRLVEAKEQLPHGEWGNWLKNNVDYSQSTANNLMQIYKEYDLNSQTFGNLSYSKAVALLGVDAEEREAFVQENNVDEMSARELQKVIKEKQQLEKHILEQEREAIKDKKELKLRINELHAELQNLREQDTDIEQEAELNRLAQELAVAESRAKQLEEELKAKPLEAKAVEVVPESIQQELDQLRKRANESADSAEVEFKILFESLAKAFNDTLVAADAVTNADTRTKYKTALHKLMDKMRAKLDEEGEEIGMSK